MEVQTADLAIEKTGPAQPDEGQVVEFTLKAINNGPSGAMGVVVTDVLPAGLTWDNNITKIASGSWNYDVATRTLTLPVLNSFRALTRAACDLLP